MQQIYLDNNSTTLIDPLVVDAMNECYQKGYVNPASQHQMGQAARRKLESMRCDIVELLGGSSRGMNADRLVFTSGGTEANNLAIIGLMLDANGIPLGQLLVSAIEHPSISGAASHVLSRGVDVQSISVNTDGVIKMNDLRSRIDLGLAHMASIMLANNETGVIQPIAECAELCRSNNILLHTDAVQAIGKIPVCFSDLGVDAMSITAHKFHGPRGIGCLLMRPTLTPSPIVFGGFQQMGMRPGTEDLALVTGLWKALQLSIDQLEQRRLHLGSLRDHLQSRLLAECEGIQIVGADSVRVPHTLNVSFLGIDRQAFLLAADMAGLAISTGSACASGSSEPSPVLISMGLDDDVIQGSVRLSLSHLSTIEEINMAADRICMLNKNLRR